MTLAIHQERFVLNLRAGQPAAWALNDANCAYKLHIIKPDAGQTLPSYLQSLDHDQPLNLIGDSFARLVNVYLYPLEYLIPSRLAYFNSWYMPL